LKSTAEMEAIKTYVIHEKIVCLIATALGHRLEISNVVGCNLNASPFLVC